MKIQIEKQPTIVRFCKYLFLIQLQQKDSSKKQEVDKNKVVFSDHLSKNDLIIVWASEGQGTFAIEEVIWPAMIVSVN